MALAYRTWAAGPLSTNVHLLADDATGDAVAIDPATPALGWLGAEMGDRGWNLRLIVATHGHWDHIGDLAALSERTGAAIGAHPLERERLERPNRGSAPFAIAAAVPTVDLADGDLLTFGELRLQVIHTPGHTAGSICLLAPGLGLLISGDTLFAGGFGRVDLPGGSWPDMVASIARLVGLDASIVVQPGHGEATTIGQERAWMEHVAAQGRLHG